MNEELIRSLKREQGVCADTHGVGNEIAVVAKVILVLCGGVYENNLK